MRKGEREGGMLSKKAILLGRILHNTMSPETFLKSPLNLEHKLVKTDSMFAHYTPIKQKSTITIF